jgi:hypothetical protein
VQTQKNKKSLKKNLNFKKNLIEGSADHILFEDESMIRDYQVIAKTWFLKGKQRIIPTTGKHRGVKLLNVLDYESGQVHCSEGDTYDAQVFLELLKEVVSLYLKGKIVMILDNSRIHNAKLIQPFLVDTLG